jgi:hypothetical protein
MWYESIGTLKYGPGWRLVLEADQGVADFYAALIPLWLPLNRQRYGAHVSVVRREDPVNKELWAKYESCPVAFEYENIVRNDETYYWLNVRCRRLEEVRVELGLPPFPWWRNGYHLTVANCKGFA